MVRLSTQHTPIHSTGALRAALLAGAVVFGTACSVPAQFSSPRSPLGRAEALPLPQMDGPMLVAPEPLPIPQEPTIEAAPEAMAEPAAEPAPEPAPEPSPEPAVSPWGLPFMPEVERWRGLVRELLAEAKVEGRLTGVESLIDEDLVLALIEQESGGDPRAESPSGALGLMQLMRPTFAYFMGLHRWGEDVSDVSDEMMFDVETNLRAGIRCLAGVIDEQGGSLYWALASYNAGGGVVNGWRAGGLGAIPAWGGYEETANYAPAILANYAAHRPGVAVFTPTPTVAPPPAPAAPPPPPPAPAVKPAPAQQVASAPRAAVQRPGQTAPPPARRR